MVGAPDSVLLLAFGGPTSPEEIRPFLDNVLRGRPVSKERYEEVVSHYEMFGGVSPLTRLTLRQAEGLRDALADEGPPLPVYVGMRHWKPHIREALSTMAGRGHEWGIGLILGAHPSHASREAYHDAVNTAQGEVGPAAPCATQRGLLAARIRSMDEKSISMNEWTCGATRLAMTM